MLKLGNTLINRLNLGVGESRRAFLGDTIVHRRAPSMRANFLTQAYSLDGIPKTFADLFTFARATAAYLWSAAATSILTPVGNNVERFTNYPLTSAPRGLALENASTNMLLRSTVFNTPPWASVSQTIAGGQPDIFGGNSGFIFTGSASNSRTQQLVNVSSNTSYTFTYVVRLGTSTTSNFPIHFNVSGGLECVPNYVAKTMAFSGPAAARGVRAEFEDLPNNKIRVRIVVTTGASDTQLTPQIKAGIGTLYVDTAMMELGNYGSSYIQTTTAAADRFMDALRSSDYRVFGIIPPRGFTVLVEFERTRPVADGVLFQIGDNANCCKVVVSNDNRLIMNLRNSNIDNSTQTATNVVVMGNVVRVAASFSANNTSMLASNVAPTILNTADMPSISQFIAYWGSRVSDQSVGANIRIIDTYSYEMNQTALEALI